jgi:hypothetical protein
MKGCAELQLLGSSQLSATLEAVASSKTNETRHGWFSV